MRHVHLAALSEQLRPGAGVVISRELHAADIFKKALQPMKRDGALKLLGVRTNLLEKSE